MKRLSLGRKNSGLRARRWDAIVLGGALPGLVAAARMGQRGHRVLVVEEEASARLPASVRDPFFLGPPAGDGVVDACLAALKIGLRDRRRIEADGITYQVVSPDTRIDVGSPLHTARELVSWGVAKPERAREVVRLLAEAAQTQLGVLLDAPLVRRSGLRGLSRSSRPSGSPEPRRTDLPDLRFLDDAALQGFLGPQIEALSQVTGRATPPAARARLLGAALLGGGSFSSSEVTLRRLLRRRVEELHGELRTVRGFELVVVDPHPGIAIPTSREVWLGRVLILNAPPGLIGGALLEQEQPLPPFLEAPPPPRRRVTLDLRCEPDVVPEGMARRVIATAPGPNGGGRVVDIARWPGRAAHDAVQLVARTSIGRDDDPEEARDAIVSTVRGIMPFSEGRLLQREHPQPRWDDDGVVLEAEPAATWPPEVELRLSSRPPVYRIPREPLGILGTEGDILIGWRAGDAISEDL
jgi:hypothetical protein